MMHYIDLYIVMQTICSYCVVNSWNMLPEDGVSATSLTLLKTCLSLPSNQMCNVD